MLDRPPTQGGQLSEGQRAQGGGQGGYPVSQVNQAVTSSKSGSDTLDIIEENRVASNPEFAEKKLRERDCSPLHFQTLMIIARAEPGEWIGRADIAAAMAVWVLRWPCQLNAALFDLQTFGIIEARRSARDRRRREYRLIPDLQ